jgi:hypothetical protein
MSTFSSDDSTCAPDPIPSPAELSRLTLDPAASQLVANTFNSAPGSTTTNIRFYQFLSHSIREMEKELSRHKDERRILYDNLFGSRKFRHKIRPIVNDYRHRLALKRRGWDYPYGRQESSDDDSYPSRPIRRSPSYTINPDDAIVILRSPSPRTNRLSPVTSTEGETPPSSGKTSTDSFHTAAETRGASSSRVEDEGETCVGCNEDGHIFRRCPKDYIYDETLKDHRPITDNDDPMQPRFVPNFPEITPVDDLKEKCERCGRFSHLREDCNTPIRSFDVERCPVCIWRDRPGIWAHVKKDCGHYDVSPAWVKRNQEMIEERDRRESGNRQE